MEKSDREFLMEANEIIRSFNSIIERKGVSTNWNAIEKRVKQILKEQHSVLYPTIKQTRLKKLNNLNAKNSE